MADNFTDWYSGSMAPPLALPGGGYAPAPSLQAPMSVEEMYQGIYGDPSSGLSSVSRHTVPVNPTTGRPYVTTAGGRASYAGGIGYGVSAAPVWQPNTVPGTVRDLGSPQYAPPGTGGGVLTETGLPSNATVEKKYTSPLPQPMLSGNARGQSGVMRSGSGSLSLADAIQPSTSDDFGPDLSSLGLDDKGAQRMADSRRGPIRANGTVYYPSGTSQPGAKRQPTQSQSQAPKRGFSLLDMLFGAGGGQQSSSGGGGFSLANAFSGGQITRAPLAGNPMLVDPGTQAGSTLSNMGFSDGAVIPAATVRGLSDRGYI